MRKVVVDEFNILKLEKEYFIEFELCAEEISSADFIYDGRNCAILQRNEDTLYLFTNLSYEVREILKSLNTITIVEKTGNNVNSAYRTDITKLDYIDYPDAIEEGVNKLLSDVKDSFSEEEYKTLLSLVKPTKSDV